MMGSRKSKIILALLTMLIALGLFCFRLIRFYQPQSIQGSLQARFAGITNETGEILVFLTNCSGWQITFYPRIETKESGFWPVFPSHMALDDIAKPRTIAPFTNEPVALVPPTNSVEWRLWVVYVATTERNRKVQKIQSFFEDVGLPSIGYRIQRDKFGLLLLPESKIELNNLQRNTN